MLDQAAALALFAIVVGGTQEHDALAKQQPLHVEDQGAAYAKVLLQTTPRGSVLARGLLTAVERDKVWHVTRSPDTRDVMTLSRTTGKLLSPLP